MFIFVTNRKLCGDNFLKRLEEIVTEKPYAVILREKDMDKGQFKELALECFEICSKYKVDFIINSNIDVALEMGIRNIQLSIKSFLDNKTRISDFNIKGVSVHSVEEGIIAEKNGADFIIAGHIFFTECKIGLEPRGLNFLKNICSSVSIPVFGIGGMENASRKEIEETGAWGSCYMSSLMKCENIKEFLKINN